MSEEQKDSYGDTGSHENFYKTIKRQRKNDLGLINQTSN
jgi:hypothetical protein